MSQTVHTPRHIYAKDGPRVIGFVRTELDGSDQIASRKSQTERILAYAAQHGFTEPTVLPTASRKDLDRATTKGGIIVTTRLSNLLRRPSDVEELLGFTAGKNIRLHVLDLGGECTEKLGIIRQVSECYTPLERLISEMKNAAKETADYTDQILTEVAAKAFRLATERLLGVKDELAKIKSDVTMAVDSPSLRERRDMASQLIATNHAPATGQAAPTPFAFHS